MKETEMQRGRHDPTHSNYVFRERPSSTVRFPGRLPEGAEQVCCRGAPELQTLAPTLVSCTGRQKLDNWLGLNPKLELGSSINSVYLR